jgi:hypothetical protein
MFLVRGHPLATLVAHKSQMHLQFFQGALLADLFPELTGVGRGARILKFRYSQPVDAGLVGRVVVAAVAQLRFSG